ncbi:DUF4373 domain-containing protein [Chitinophaga sp. LS1]|uniref:DUF4373 domain-containing protein n=1 Tax=Chitinophaga sp. LS1 TaxID=3051176 RepID=UPI002AAB5C34|nr:DUF4373 domain-containing protein [Chitinophaga sp. LS1]WPV66310.1 DUF4373 domain-containing protein [Chitinophaga sp. LS1]
MARPAKIGLDYFPIDIDLDQDDKLGMIIGEYGSKGELLWMKLLGWIYKNEGYFAEWNEEVQLKFLRRYNYCGFSLSFVNEVVPRFIKWGLLDQTVFNTFHILTSERIQKTWLDATRKRKDRVLNENIWLLEVNDGNQAEETQNKAEVINKLNKRKEKEIKEELIVPEEAAPHPPPTENSSSQKDKLQEKQGKLVERQQKFYQELTYYLEQYKPEMLRAFYNHWSEPNRSKTKMKCELEETWDLKLRLIKWEKNDAKFNKVKNNSSDGQQGSQSTEEYQRKRKELEERTRRLSSQ